MPSPELIERVTELRRNGRTPKEIARALGLKPAEVAPLIRAVGAAAPKVVAPVAGCWISDSWGARLTVNGHSDWPGVQGGTENDAGLVDVVVARERGSSVTACAYLVDAWCLGVKNCIGPKSMDKRRLPAFVSHVFSVTDHTPVPAPLELAQHLVFGAVDYARGMGLEPHSDFAKCVHILGEWSGSSDIAFGRDGVPMYMQGPHDNVFAILATLRKTVGDGNFHYLARIG
jgi:hypothetical protein